MIGSWGEINSKDVINSYNTIGLYNYMIVLLNIL